MILAKLQNPRLSNLTLKVIGVNAITLLILLFGVLYLGQYRTRIVIEKLERFTSEVELIAMGLSASDARYNDQLIRAYARATNNKITLFATNEKISIEIVPQQKPNTKRIFHSVEVLKAIVRVISFHDDDRNFDVFPVGTYPGIQKAVRGDSNFAVWTNDKNQFILSAAAPIMRDNTIHGAVFVMRQAYDIEDELSTIWKNIMMIFTGAFIVTFILSLYFAGTIATPLRRLSRAAERVRTGKPHSVKIPNLTHRYDEIGDLSRSLQLMTDALWARMNAIDSFAADVSHELKNPLTSLKSAVETLPKITKKKDRETLLDIIVKDIARIDRLITDIAKSSRLDATLGAQAQTEVNMYTFLSGILKTYRDPETMNDNDSDCDIVVTVDHKTLCLHADHHNKTITVFSTADQFKQVITNIIDNALSFTPDHGTIDIHLSHTKTHAVITIEDEGIGIPPEKAETIFDRFYSDRADSGQDSQHSGLGLSICKQIIAAMHGTIHADNKDSGTGARFVIRLPV